MTGNVGMLILALTLAALACSSSSSSESGGGGAGAAGAPSASGGSGGASNCASTSARADCETCCQALDPVGHASAVEALTQDCGCNTGAPCATECADNVCAGAAVTDPCTRCITGQSSAAGKACVAQVIMACVTDQSCPPVVVCEQACMKLP